MKVFLNLLYFYILYNCEKQKHQQINNCYFYDFYWINIFLEECFKKNFKSYTLFLWDFYFSFNISFFLCVSIFYIFLYMNKFNKIREISNGFNNNLDIQLIEKKVSNLNFIFNINYIYFSLSFLGVPIFNLYISSFNFGVIYYEVEQISSYYGFILKTISYQWGWIFSLVFLTPNILSNFLYPSNTNLFVYTKNNYFFNNINLNFYIKSFSRTNLVEELNDEFNCFLIPNKIPIIISTTSKDVNHALGVVDLGLKMDSTNEKITQKLIIILSEEGREFDFNCYEFCGENHPLMGGFFLITDFNTFYLL